MIVMVRALLLATLLSAAPVSGAQPTGVLHIKIALTDADRKSTPVARHVLLISDNPASAPPHRVVTTLDGTAEVVLRPGNYTVESDQPVAFQGKGYQWIQMVDIVAGRDSSLQLTAENAEVGPLSASMASASPAASDISLLLPQWQDSVVALWTPTTHASGFVFDAKGLIATNQRVVGKATSVEVQLTPAVKVTGKVVVADPVRDVAVVWIDPAVLGSVRPVPLGCSATKPAVAAGQEIFTIASPLRGLKRVMSGNVSLIEPHTIVFDANLATGSAGGPVFATDGNVVGLTSVVDENDDHLRGDSRVVRIDDASCDVLTSADKKLTGAAAPSGAHLPIEPSEPFPVNALKDAAQHRAGSLNPYEMTSADYDVGFITPVLTYGARYQAEQASRRERTKAGKRAIEVDPPMVRPLMDFGSWSDYVEDFPPVLLIRVTPRLVEGLLTKVARGAAQVQGVAIPPIKRFKSGFSRLRAFCGETEITPIHPFKLEQHVSDTDTITEGLYVFAPDALTPQCGTVKLVLYSEKEPDKADTRVVDPRVIEQIWQDFAPYRNVK
jgi:S1-C subfamily serine protease